MTFAVLIIILHHFLKILFGLYATFDGKAIKEGRLNSTLYGWNTKS